MGSIRSLQVRFQCARGNGGGATLTAWNFCAIGGAKPVDLKCAPNEQSVQVGGTLRML